MGSRLRKAKKNNTGIGGKGPGKLTDKVINELSLYYGLAIRRNPESVENMKNEVWATYFHKISTDSNPQHHFCPQGSSSWCKWQVAEAEETLDEFQHNNPPLTEAVQKVIKPIYEDLSSESLLERCLGSETQNNNESLNSLIWTFAPKHIHAVLKILSSMGKTIGPESHAFVNKRDQVRINRSEVRATEASKETRTAKSSERASLNMTFEFEEGTLYGAGIAD
ncbi:uncharacterized protein LOC123264734 isoform X2 [Cotesia glomerata]|uniref:uncharacterized protein LOC123264734 isoform X2 n=1 Tax=Cotesia glomerata TaxID=32391 RepID=UPI001D03397C|nr:uncharacterized protein LOC123264734 isoform X2 [Cotesia glomerata]